MLNVNFNKNPVKNPTNAPNDIFIESLILDPSILAPIRDPNNGPIIMPIPGKKNRPIISPIIDPFIAFLPPPNFLTP